ncbi:tRNA uridine-5-carboxymethylaminomethyl(34) synthesis GTPase MnmE [Candidatus Methylacidiphilum infernorum]|uniref:tRNA modification GTPase MnmE n=1 Tax=Candidatus Methylacidiphilum infernorum TaxID=511746 RepID=A0ABX7PTB2_9BACT|nr:tRNA uridine-5-carboxymethylaminomethyl(34) synthesis GTPase MnmE [Candidatus Methylacidiphilum infernorum]QSR86065.1 tRNA uridine-5-carboxymethylaminomethyl(34) synthesis GTPase MnmE [Candidatus Methylacidiphilum infernorum]
MEDTIVAPATPPALSAIALIRMSGPKSLEIISSLLRKSFKGEPQRLYYRKLYFGEELLDDVVLSYWKSPRSYTGEDMIEISCHGNPYIVERILEACLKKGARLASPGEFTKRAFLNGKMDLTQAEAIIDLIHAGGMLALKSAQALQSGGLSKELLRIRAELIDILAEVEAYIDFPEEDIQPEVGDQLIGRLLAMENKLSTLLSSAPLSRVLREGVTIVLAGSPNVGKSSLFNALLKENRAIVSPHPGTTRDTIEAECRIGSFLVKIIDTAGQRVADDQIEAEGIRRAQEAVKRGDLILHLVSAPDDPSTDPYVLPQLQAQQKVIAIASKADLGIHPANKDKHALSIVTGMGLEELEEKIKKILESFFPMDFSYGVNPRQQAALAKMAEALNKAILGIKNSLPPELISSELHECLERVGEIVGLVSSEDILDKIFQKFCIGK